MPFFFFAGGDSWQSIGLSIGLTVVLTILQQQAGGPTTSTENPSRRRPPAPAHHVTVPAQAVPLLFCGAVFCVAYVARYAYLTWAGARPAGGRPGRDEAAFDAALARIRKQAVEVYVSPGKMPLKDLRRRLGPRADGCIERRELEAAFVDMMDTCVICSEPYVDDDVYRKLGCAHCFHIECIDRWALTNASKGKAPTCPLCNAAL
mmetsp:Transcript_29126/g.87072  ORF Transcript_29126/g.87072 Transcript_29126/m.87072 type:complete len:205 (-) Transcript_29126:50-664(-)